MSRLASILLSFMALERATNMPQPRHEQATRTQFPKKADGSSPRLAVPLRASLYKQLGCSGSSQLIRLNPSFRQFLLQSGLADLFE